MESYTAEIKSTLYGALNSRELDAFRSHHVSKHSNCNNARQLIRTNHCYFTVVFVEIFHDIMRQCCVFDAVDVNGMWTSYHVTVVT